MLEIGVKAAGLAPVRSSSGRRTSPLKLKSRPLRRSLVWDKSAPINAPLIKLPPLDSGGLEASSLSIDAIVEPSGTSRRCSCGESVQLDENHRSLLSRQKRSRR
ncbi:unnamed protein product [Citrullus colocynthis]|uniref:Uncharacterized protein n=1 Tax=Citrullus colocynthis TaxID=252529 RepID=A0ABP0YND4_9ROSI